MAHLVVEQQHTDLLLPRNPKVFGFAQASFHHHAPANTLFASHNHNLPVRTVTTTNKRRLERDEEDDENLIGDDEDGRHDRRRRASPSDAMDRSPTPERVRKSLPKRLRMTATIASAKDKTEVKQESDQDVGVLLARLPPQSLLPILTSLIQTRPELKPVVLTLIPRPTLETAMLALADASRKLRDAYPYSQGHAQPFSSLSFGFGGSSSFGIPAPVPLPQRAPAIRDEYVLSRLRTPIADFISTAFSYLSYFSFTQSTQSLSAYQLLGNSPNPSETYSFLAALTSDIFSQQPLAVNALCQEIQPRLIQEWEAWLNRVDNHVNKEGGMFPAGLVQSWIDQLDKFAVHTQYPLGGQMRAVRDAWVNRVGWLIGRNAVMNDI